MSLVCKEAVSFFKIYSVQHGDQNKKDLLKELIDLKCPVDFTANLEPEFHR